MPRVWILVGLVAAVLFVVISWRMRVFMAGGRALLELALIGAVVGVLLWPRKES